MTVQGSLLRGWLAPAAWLVLAAAAHLPNDAAAQLPAPAVSAPVPFHLGGYGSVVVNSSRAGDSTRISESSLALLASGTLLPRLAWFTELDAVSSSRENYAGRQDDRILEVARLYAEYTVTDAARIRVGRFLTPFGQWNESPGEPVTWTAVRPLTTYRPFAKEATGGLLAGTYDIGGHDFGYALYAGRSVGSRDSNEVRFDRALGGRVAVELRPGFWIGASAASVAETRPEDDTTEAGAFDNRVSGGAADVLRETGGTDSEVEVRDQSSRALVGLDARLRVAGVDLLAETAALSRSRGLPGQNGAFVQAALPTGLRDVALVGRAEWFQPPVGSRVRSATVALNYRAPNRVTFKLERQLSDSPSVRVARGWFAAVSLLF